jgi:hypothetical protein
MNTEQLLQQTNAVDAIARELGIDPATAEAGAAALLPKILSGFQEPAAAAEPQPAIGGRLGGSGGLGGLGGLLGTIGALGGGGLLDNVTSSQPTEINKGNEILGQIFGSKDESRAVAARAAAQTGVEPSLLKKMLPILAMTVAGYVMKQAGQGAAPSGGGLGGGALGDMLGGIFGGQAAAEGGDSNPQAAPAASGASGASGDILGQLIGAAGKYLGR